MASPASPSTPIQFIQGKGGVGRTSISRAMALEYSRRGLKAAWVCFGQNTYLTDSRFETIEVNPISAFREYLDRKVPMGFVAKLVLDHKFVHQLVMIAPGFKELLCMGKLWDIRADYQAIIVDMPSTGYGLIYFEALKNFHSLFQGGRIHEHTQHMLQTFSDPDQTRFWIATLPEETPLKEARELKSHLVTLFPHITPKIIVNKLFPKPNETATHSDAEAGSPIPESLQDYAISRFEREQDAIAAASELHFKILPVVQAPVVENLSRKVGELLGPNHE